MRRSNHFIDTTAFSMEDVVARSHDQGWDELSSEKTRSVDKLYGNSFTVCHTQDVYASKTT